MIIKYICIVLATLQMWTFNIFTSDKKQSIGVNKFMEHQTFETFGTSSCWWSQNIDDEETAREIARLLYDDETGLGLDIYRYNIGGGEHDNPACRIGDVNRRTESFYVFNWNRKYPGDLFFSVDLKAEGFKKIKKEEIYSPSLIIKSTVLKYPNISILFFEFAGIKYVLFT